MQFRKFIVFFLSALCLAMPLNAQPLTIEQRLESMTLEEKVGQMFVMSFFGADLNFAARDLLETWQPGAIVLLPSNLENPVQITRLTNDIQQTLLDSGSLPAFISVDQEGGIIAHLDNGFTEFPVPSLLTATQNPELAYQFGNALADELLAVGINMNLAPVADLQTNLDNPIIGRRSFGSDPQLVAPIVSAVVAGMQDNGVMATVKHFPGHGDTASDSHLELPELSLDTDELLARELIPFQATLDVNVGAVMVAHIYFSAIDDVEDTPSSLSPNIITGLLRDTLGYDGLVITDALDMDAIDTVYSPTNAALQAITAGNDLILLGAHISPENQAIAMQAVVDAVNDGTLSESRIDASVHRILEAKERFNILDWQPLDPITADQRIDIETHEALVGEMFTQGITLLADDNQLLPLSDNVLYVYSGTRPTLGTACARNDWSPLAISLYPSDAEITQIQSSASNYDAVVVFTENLASNPNQLDLVQGLSPEQTLVVALWSPYDRLLLPEIGAFFITYSPLSQAYSPICDILHGESNAQGTLSLLLDAQ